MNDLITAAQQALEALMDAQRHNYALKHKETDDLITALKAALAEPTVKESLTTGSCIACGNRMTGPPESFVVDTAEVGVTAPEGYSPQQVEALHSHKGRDKVAPPLADRIADCLVEDHIALMRENERLRSALAEQMQKPCGSYTRWENTMCNPVGNPRTQQENAWHDGYASAKEEARLAPPQRKPLSEEEIIDATEHIDTSRNGYFIHIARAIERAHGITDPQVADRLACHGIPMPEGDNDGR